MVSVTDNTLGGSGGSGCRGVVYHVFIVESCELDAIIVQSGVIAILKKVVQYIEANYRTVSYL